MSNPNLLVGIGSSHGSDSVGWQVAMQIQPWPPSGCDVRTALVPADILDWIEPYQTVHICDACSGNAARPTVHRWRWPDARIEKLAWGGTHDLGLPGVLDLAVTLGLAPADMVLWGIEIPGEFCEADHAAAVERVARDAAEQIRQELESVAGECRRHA